MKLRNLLTSALAATALAAIPAQAGDDPDVATAVADSNADAISASSLMQADLRSGEIQFANVEDMVLSSDGGEVEYVLFKIKEGQATEASRIGFAPWDDIRIGAENVERDLVITPTDSEGPQQLRLTQEEANTRMLSRVLDSDLAFADGVVRPIDDVLFDPQTGAVKDIVVQFADNDRRIPVEFIRLTGSDGYSVVQPSDYGYTVYIVG